VYNYTSGTLTNPEFDMAVEVRHVGIESQYRVYDCSFRTGWGTLKPFQHWKVVTQNWGSATIYNLGKYTYIWTTDSNGYPWEFKIGVGADR